MSQTKDIRIVLPANSNPQPYKWTYADIIKAAKKRTLWEVPRDVLKANLNKVYRQESVVNTALEESNEDQLLEVLDSENVQIPQHYGRTILHLFGRKGKIKQIKQFVTKENLLLKAEDGNTVLHEVARSGTLKEVQELLDPKMLKVTSLAQFTPCHMLGFVGSFEQLGEYLTYENLSAKATGNQTPLHIAAQYARNAHWVTDVEPIIKVHPELLTQHSISGSVLSLMEFHNTIAAVPIGIPLKDIDMEIQFEDFLGSEWMIRNAELLKSLDAAKNKVSEQAEPNLGMDMF